MFAWVVGLGALLLFEVQLVLGKQLLPRFGGTSAVWTTCLLFFQAALLGGYAWAHLLSSRLSARRQRDAHLALLGAAVAVLAWRALAWPSPITPDAAGRVAGAPAVAILGWLATTIGLPFVVLAATSPLLQAWFARARPGVSPFWLFALSNAGSLAGLVAYPLLVEPALPILAQGQIWSVAFVVYAGGVAWCAWVASREGGSHARHPEGGSHARHPEGGSRPAPEGSATRTALWLALAFVPSVLLAAVTSHLTQEVATVPLLWVIPLALYLASFVLSFAWPDAFRRVWRVALAAAAGLATLGLFAALELEAGVRVALWCVVLFVYATASHGELARLRPAPSRLTGYYLAIAWGGVLGGLFCAVLAPLVFDGYWELHLGLLLGPVAVLAGAVADPSSHATTEAPRDDGTEAPRDDGHRTTEAFVRQIRVAAVLAIAALAVALGVDVAGQGRGVERASRSFYGVLRVVREGRGDPDERLRLLHGRISHGLQLVAPARRAEATTYYGPASGVGAALRRHPRRRAGASMRVGVVGLGVGTLAAYAKPGDVFRFYELDPAVARLSAGPEPVFTFLRDARGAASVTLGDGRVVLEGEEPQAFDVLVLDAFSSDAIPAHLLTREAFAVYLRHLAEGGVLAVHVTNRHLDLEPVVRAAAAALGLEAEKIPSLESGLTWSADWMLVARDRVLLDDEALSAGTLPWPYRDRDVLWTDGWSNVLGVLKR